MTATCTVVKEESRLLQGRSKLEELKGRYADLKISDTGHYTNQNVAFARALGDMLAYSDALLEASIARKESRGSHYRSDYPERVDDPFHQTAKVHYNRETGRPDIEWESIPSPLVPLRARTYGKVDKQEPKEDQEAVAASAAAQVSEQEQVGGDGYSQQPAKGEGMPMDRYSGPEGGNPEAK